jgi:hypothetical protein
MGEGKSRVTKKEKQKIVDLFEAYMGRVGSTKDEVALIESYGGLFAGFYAGYLAGKEEVPNGRGSDIKKSIDDLVGAYEKRIATFKEAVDDLCDLLEEEWGNGDGMPEKATEKYRRACRAIGRSPVYGGIG